jgi:hypothetical protein
MLREGRIDCGSLLRKHILPRSNNVHIYPPALSRQKQDQASNCYPLKRKVKVRSPHNVEPFAKFFLTLAQSSDLNVKP